MLAKCQKKIDCRSKECFFIQKLKHWLHVQKGTICAKVFIWRTCGLLFSVMLIFWDGKPLNLSIHLKNSVMMTPKLRLLALMLPCFCYKQSLSIKSLKLDEMKKLKLKNSYYFTKTIVTLQKQQCLTIRLLHLFLNCKLFSLIRYNDPCSSNC